MTITSGRVNAAVDISWTKLKSNLDRKINRNVFLELVLNSSPSRINDISFGKAVLFPSEIALINILSEMDKSTLLELIEFFIDVLNRLETFKHENYIQIKKLAPILKHYGLKNTKPLAYFDREEMVAPPDWVELVQLNNLILEIKASPISKVNAILQGSSKKPRKGSVLTPMKQLHALVESGMSVYEGSKKCHIAGDKGNIYRAYQNWHKNWEKSTYWE